jgi:hypothetical protein
VGFRLGHPGRVGPQNRAPRPGIVSIPLSLWDIEWTSHALPIPLVFGTNGRGRVWVTPGGVIQKTAHRDRGSHSFRYPSWISSERPMRSPSRWFLGRTGEVGIGSPRAGRSRKPCAGTGGCVRSAIPLGYRTDVSRALHPAGF